MSIGWDGRLNKRFLHERAERRKQRRSASLEKGGSSIVSTLGSPMSASASTLASPMNATSGSLSTRANRGAGTRAGGQAGRGAQGAVGSPASCLSV